MIRLYTAIGRYEVRKNQEGQSYPVIIIKEEEYLLSMNEMILWTQLIWNIATYPEAQQMYYQKEQETHCFSEYDFDYILERLLKRGLIQYGSDYTGIDALYNLMSNLYIRPVETNVLTKLLAFCHLTFMKRVAFSKSKKVFVQEVLTKDEKKVMFLSHQYLLSTAELITCVEKKVKDVSTNDKVLQALYEEDDITCDNIGFLSRFYTSKQPMLIAISNLYLKKQILLESL